jgi:hypothetical protein
MSHIIRRVSAQAFKAWIQDDLLNSASFSTVLVGTEQDLSELQNEYVFISVSDSTALVNRDRLGRNAFVVEMDVAVGTEIHSEDTPQLNEQRHHDLIEHVECFLRQDEVAKNQISKSFMNKPPLGTPDNRQVKGFTITTFHITGDLTDTEEDTMMSALTLQVTCSIGDINS